MTVTIRNARVEDIPHMARVAIQAFGGYAEIMYEGAIPGRTVEQIVEHRFSRNGRTSSISNSRVAEENGIVLGGLHAFPMDLLDDDPKDLLIADDSHPFTAPFDHLHAGGSFYINAVAVYPQYRRRGIARRLMERAEAEAAAMSLDVISLHVFAGNLTAVRLYNRVGYQEVARQTAVYHPSLRYGGDLLLMTKRL